MEQNMTNVTKYRPRTELSLRQRRVNHDSNATSDNDDWNEQYMLKVGKEMDQLLTVEWNEIRILDPDIFFHLHVPK